MLLVDVVGDREKNTQRVQSRATLETGTCKLAHSALHFVLLNKVLGGLGYVEEAIDLLLGDG